MGPPSAQPSTGENSGPVGSRRTHATQAPSRRAVLVDCKTSDVDAAAHFWSRALGRAVDPNHPGTRGNYRMLDTPPDEPIVQIQRVDHESRVHLDIETDDIPAEVERLTKLVRPWIASALGGDAGAHGAASVWYGFAPGIPKTPIVGTSGRKPGWWQAALPPCAPRQQEMNRIIRKDSLFNCSLRIPSPGAFRPLVIGTGSL
jgi:hypothetical protein